MGAIGGALGLGGGAGGTGFASPQGASQGQADATYNQAQKALTQQQGFVNGVVNNANPALGYQNAALQQFANVANGQGPNPAQAQLNQATGQNVANQAALMAGQRGANQNVGLIARQAAQQGAGTQQQAIGQAATLQAQQQLNALQGMAGQANTIVGQAQSALGQQVSGTQGEQSNILNSLAGQNQANASMANTRMGQQGSLVGGVFNGIGGALGLANGGQVPKPMYAQGSYVQAPQMSDDQWNALAANPNQPQITTPVAAPIAAQVPSAKVKVPQQQPQQNQQDNLYKGASSFGSFLANKVSGLFHSTPGQSSPDDQYSASGFSPQQMADDRARTDAVNAGGIPASSPVDSDQGNQTEQMPANNDGQPMAAKGGKVPAMVSPGEKRIKKEDLSKVAAGKNPMEVGKTIPGKPKVSGAKNSYANDTVPMTLNEGDIILPRSVTQSKHPHWAAHKFVAEIMAKNGQLPKKAK